MQYPGHDTEFFIVLNQVTTGPIVGLENLQQYPIEPDTPVWYEGIDDWKPALIAPLTAQLFNPDSDFFRAMEIQQQINLQAQAASDSSTPPPIPSRPVPTPEADQPPTIPAIPAHEKSNIAQTPDVPNVAPAPKAQRPGYQPLNTQYEANAAEIPARPKTYLAWAIVTIVVFNLLCGVIALIYSIKVRSKYRRGNYIGAERCSNTTQWWIAGGITLGIIMMVVRMFLNF